MPDLRIVPALTVFASVVAGIVVGVAEGWVFGVIALAAGLVLAAAEFRLFSDRPGGDQ